MKTIERGDDGRFSDDWGLTGESLAKVRGRLFAGIFSGKHGRQVF
jgi:hypothetical protein